MLYLIVGAVARRLFIACVGVSGDGGGVFLAVIHYGASW